MGVRKERIIKINTPEWVGKILALLGLGQIKVDQKEILRKEADQKKQTT